MCRCSSGVCVCSLSLAELQLMVRTRVFQFSDPAPSSCSHNAAVRVVPISLFPFSYSKKVRLFVCLFSKFFTSFENQPDWLYKASALYTTLYERAPVAPQSASAGLTLIVPSTNMIANTAKATVNTRAANTLGWETVPSARFFTGF